MTKTRKYRGGGGDQPPGFPEQEAIAQAAADQAVGYALQVLDAAIVEDAAIHATEVAHEIDKAHKDRSKRSDKTVRDLDRTLSVLRDDFEKFSKEYIQRSSKSANHDQSDVATKARLDAAQKRVEAAQARLTDAQALNKTYHQIEVLASAYTVACCDVQSASSQVVGGIRALAHAKTIAQRHTAEERLVTAQARVAPAIQAREAAHAAFIAVSAAHPLTKPPRVPPPRTASVNGARIELEQAQLAQTPARVEAVALAALRSRTRVPQAPSLSNRARNAALNLAVAEANLNQALHGPLREPLSNANSQRYQMRINEAQRRVNNIETMRINEAQRSANRNRHRGANNTRRRSRSRSRNRR